MKGKTSRSRRIRERNHNQFWPPVSGQLSKQSMLLSNQEDDLQSKSKLIVQRSQESPGTTTIMSTAGTAGHAPPAHLEHDIDDKEKPGRAARQAPGAPGRHRCQYHHAQPHLRSRRWAPPQIIARTMSQILQELPQHGTPAHRGQAIAWKPQPAAGNRGA